MEHRLSLCRRPNVTDLAGALRGSEIENEVCHIPRVDIVSNLLAFVAEDFVLSAPHGELYRVSRK